MPPQRAFSSSEADPSSLAANCAVYIERIFPRQARRSRLAREAGLHLTVCIDLDGPGGGRWSCQWKQGELISAKRGLDASATVTYRTDVATFQAIVAGVETPQEAFFDERIAIAGDLETALKLAVLFRQFIAENPFCPNERTEAPDVPICRS